VSRGLHALTLCRSGTRALPSKCGDLRVAHGLRTTSLVTLTPFRAALLTSLFFALVSQTARAQEARSYAEAGARTTMRDSRQYGGVTVWIESGGHEVSSTFGRVSPAGRSWLLVEASGARLTVQRPGDAAHNVRLDHQTGDVLLTAIDDASARREGGLALTLTAMTVTAATSAVLGELGCVSDAASCDRRTWSAVFGGIAAGLQFMAGIILWAQPDGLDIERRRGRSVRRYHPHARGFTVTPALFHGLAAGRTLGVIPYVAMQDPSLGVERPWDALGPGMVAMAAAPFLVAMAGELGGGRGQLWAALVGSIAGWLGMGIAQLVAGATGSSSTGLPGLIVGSALSVVGATIGYAVSDATDLGDDPSFSPTLEVGTMRASVGAIGHF
jgi:hypothetical protein